MIGTRSWAFGMVVALAGCTQGSTIAPSFPPTVQTPTTVGALPNAVGSLNRASSRIHHIVIIVQENRSTNNLFNGLPGADTVRVAENSQGKHITLMSQLLTAPYDISHSHRAFTTEYAAGKLDGFDQVQSHCDQKATCPPEDVRAYAYVPEAEVEPYFDMAKRWTFASQMFQSNQGPSFPAHLYILNGTSAIEIGSELRAAENPVTPHGKFTGGCDSPSGSLVTLIDSKGQENRTAYPCFYRISIIQLLEHQSLSWRYYQVHLGPGLWHTPAAIGPVFHSAQFSTDVVSPPSQFYGDVDSGKLANVVWVTPTAAASDHSGITDGSGPSWVASIVNKIGQSRYWKDTAIFVTWDDWGGWYDPIVPTQYNSYELGLRVPLIVISPYAKEHYISTKQHEFGSILKFIEKTFGLGSLGTTDLRADDLSDCFNFSRRPHKFSVVPARLQADYFLKQPISDEDPDDDR